MTDDSRPDPIPGNDPGNDNEGTLPDLERPRKNTFRWLLENFLSLGLALLLVFAVRSTFIEPFKIPSGSMIPTLLIGDHIFVNKFAYGLKVPFWDLITGEPAYLIKRDPPRRGDIIVFMYPKDESFYYIKRVIGIPGDTVEIKNKVLFINQKQVQRELAAPEISDRVFKSMDDPKYSPANQDLYSEHLDAGDHLELLDKNSFMGESHGPVTVPAESLFVMGDNRDFSNDSRFWGFVPMRNVKGRAFVIWLSVWPNWGGDGKFMWHPERIGTLLR
jgi:signal peptidase I